jgi:regulatory protein YycI of two-component signal transduction system YycFG
MKQNNNGSKIIIIVVFFMGLMFFIPIIVISLIDGFSSFMLIPIITFLFMISVFFTIIFVANKSYQKQNQFTRDGYQTLQRHCIQCHEEIETSDTYCPHCGTEQTEYIVCDYCGHKNNKHNLQCEKCNALIK